ncbi:UPF0158 family protein [Oscillatoria sp. CS-180]|uniref:UPF0158 family protein n=1 Tax=Oscillatoria sp. CS-180 TaxID=3021720 RepID=UPI00232C9CA1|nr:UPF0158 family protein [Oscillatoria sp. CS-180]MDB9525326.1 UPF0158 family protein [Oscillatoria sp. CS-180]
MSTVKVPIDLEMLEEGFENTSGEISFYLDVKTGQIAMESSDFPSGILVGEGDFDEETFDLSDSSRFLPIPMADSREGYRDMEAFINTLENPILKDKLEIAIDGSGAFRRFKNVLIGEPERERWFAFKQQQLRQRIFDWLEVNGIEVENCAAE